MSSSLEASLSARDFSAKKWLESELRKSIAEQSRRLDELESRISSSSTTEQLEEISSSSQMSVDLQLTEIHFNVRVLQSRCQDEMQAAQEHVHKNCAAILQKQQEAVEGLAEIEELLIRSKQAQQIISTPLSNAAFAEVNEMVEVKNRLDKTLAMFDTIAQLPEHEASLRAFIEDGDLVKVHQKCSEVASAIAIQMKLPKLNSNYERAEIFVHTVIAFVQDILHLALLANNEKSFEKLATIHNILVLLNQQQVFTDALLQHKLTNKQKEAIDRITQATKK